MVCLCLETVSHYGSLITALEAWKVEVVMKRGGLCPASIPEVSSHPPLVTDPCRFAATLAL